MPSAWPVVWIPTPGGPHVLGPGDLIEVVGGVIALRQMLRVTQIKVHANIPAFMVYISGYAMNAAGHAIGERRDALLDVRHLRLLEAAPLRARNGRPANAGRVLPRQRADADGRPVNAARVRSRGEAGAR